MQLRSSQLKPGMIIYFCNSIQKTKNSKYKRAEVLERYKYFCTVKVYGCEDATYIEALGYTSIGCGDIIVKDSIKANELISKDDIALED